MKRPPSSRRGFTLVELLATITTLGILAALLLPNLAYGKFKARSATCTNNYRQFALAAAMYAGEDSKGRLPSFPLPTETTQLAHFRNLYPWIVGLQTLKAMEPHGIAQPQMWFCPLRERWQDNSSTFQAWFQRPMVSIADYTRYFTDVQRARYAAVDLNWWVPRPLEGSETLTYPDAALLTTRLQTPWPAKMDDLTVSTRPILSDWMLGSKDPAGDSFVSASGGHGFAGKIRSVNSGYADGHVVSHSGSDIKWELRLTDGENVHVFY